MATKKKADVVKEEVAPVDVLPEELPLPGTPVDASIPEADYVPLGVAVEEPQFDAPEDADEGESVDDVEPALEATPAGPLVVDMTAGSTRPEDGFVAE
jgi:hypothetical protein